MSDRVAVLELEVAELREEIDSLRGELTRVRRSIAGLRAEGRGSSLSQTPQRSSQYETRSEDSYSVISDLHRDLPERAGPELCPGDRAPAGAPTPLPSSSGGRTVTPASLQISWLEREAIAEEVGRFLARALTGNHRGGSGRDKDPIASRLWIVCRDYWGQIYAPVRVFRSWCSCKRLCKPSGHDPGSAVFVGFPSERECKRAIAAAGLVWPEVIEQ